MPDYGSKSYWTERYAREDEPFDWMCDYAQLQHTLLPLLHDKVNDLKYAQTGVSTNKVNRNTPKSNRSPKILIVGCGNAPFSHDFQSNSGFETINIDCCDVVIEQQKKRYPHMNWRVVDALDMKDVFQDGYFDFIIDKSLIDTTMCYPNGHETTRRLYRELHRVLKPEGGRLITISLHSEDEVREFGSSDDYEFVVNTCKISNMRRQEEDNDIQSLYHTLAVFDKVHVKPNDDEGKRSIVVKFENILSDKEYRKSVQNIMDREGDHCGEQKEVNLPYLIDGGESPLFSIQGLREVLQENCQDIFSKEEVEKLIQDVLVKCRVKL